MSLTIQILIKNNQETIEKCIQSILPLKSRIIIADLGCTDNTTSICESYGIRPEKHSLNDNFSKVRNRLLEKSKTKWQMYIDPHEYLISGHKEIIQTTSSENEESYCFQVLQGTVLTRELRLWSKKNQFVNPVFETILDKDSKDIGCLICSNQSRIDIEQRIKIIDKWKKSNPTCADPYYYQALTLLLKNQYTEFVSVANHYLFLKNIGMADTMLRYYLSMIQIYKFGEINAACRNIMMCIAQRPLMAEFWCLLGDINYQTKQYEKAIEFYNNAIILGSRRQQTDRWPMDISKYKEYPLKMINNAKEIIVKTKTYHEI